MAPEGPLLDLFRHALSDSFLSSIFTPRSSLVHNLKAKESQKIRILRRRPPALAGMLVEHIERDFLNRARLPFLGAGVVDDPVVASGFVDDGIAQINHHMIRKLLRSGLIIKQQVPFFCQPSILADEYGIIIL